MTRFLCDTHALLWWLHDPARLRQETFALIEDQANDVFVSAATVWEIAIKKKQGKLNATINVVQAITDKGFTPLPISLAHAEGAGALPLHHRDPFDRVLVAQANAEGLTLISDDPQIARYEVRRLRAS